MLTVVLFTLTIAEFCFSLQSISCRDKYGKPVDWFVGYKLPTLSIEESSSSSLSGVSFLYADDRSLSWSEPEDIGSVNSSVGSTLKQYYNSVNDLETFYMLYNDEHPETEKVDSYRGHAKGFAVFDSDSGFWIIHSVPNFPPTRRYSYPTSGHRNGQSFLCITLKTESLSDFAKQMMYIRPSIYESQIPTEFASRFPELQSVIAKKSFKRTTNYYSVQPFVSPSGMVFINFAKHRKYGQDIYADMMAPYLKSSLFTETWMNGPGDLPSFCEPPYQVNNVRSVLVAGRPFTSSKDHSKWAVSTSSSKPYICIGDLNRQVSQTERGGGSVCMKNRKLWSLFDSSVSEVESCKPRYRNSEVKHSRRESKTPILDFLVRKLKDALC